MTEPKCDVCGVEENVECEILLKGDVVDRIYHLCPKHWVTMYRRTLESFTENNEYKVSSYIKMSCDKMIADAVSNAKIDSYTTDEGGIDIELLNPKDIKKLRSYKDNSEDDDYE